MFEGIDPGHVDKFYLGARVSTFCDCSASLNFKSTNNAPNFSICASTFCWRSA